MKKTILLFMLPSLFIVPVQKLLAQEVQSATDSSIFYKFSSELDSLPHMRHIWRSVDSGYHYRFETFDLWDSESDVWEPSSKNKMVNDEQGRVMQSVGYKWDVTKAEWDPRLLIDYERNQSGHLLVQTNHKWHPENQVFIEDKKQRWYPNASGLDTLYIQYSKDVGSEEWEPALKTRNCYSFEGQLDTTWSYIWDAGGNAWSLFKKLGFENTYDERGNLISSIEWRYEIQSDRWIRVVRMEFQYDETDRIMLDAQYNWDMSLEIWFGVKKAEFSFDSEGNQVAVVQYKWDVALEDWDFSFRKDLAYNAAGSVLSEVFGYWYGNPEDPNWGELVEVNLYDELEQDSIQIKFKWDEVLDLSYLSSKKYFYRGELNVKDYTAYENVPSPILLLYPVPVRDQLMIESEVPFSRVELIDLNGRLVFSSGQVLEGLNLSSFRSGIYMIRLKDWEGKLIGTRTIVKE